jgi:hypothetical protein
MLIPHRWQLLIDEVISVVNHWSPRIRPAFHSNNEAPTVRGVTLALMPLSRLVDM